MSTVASPPDRDQLAWDAPESIGPDHDETLAADFLVPESPPLWVPEHSGKVIWTPFDKMDLHEAVGANVRFSREIHQNMHGKDVLGHKRALSRARPDLYEWAEFTDVAGEFFMDAVVKYKKAHRLGTARVLGGKMHESLERQRRKNYPKEWAFDARAIGLCDEYWNETHITPEQRIRSAGVNAAAFWYAHRMSTSYSQYRPMQLGKPPWYASRWDCSGFSTGCHYAGGAIDPNRRGYDHLGYTGTMIGSGTRVGSVEQLSPLDLIFFGFSSGRPGFNAGDPTHVAVYAGFINGMHMIYSLGSYPMRFTVYNYRRDINHYRHYSVA